MENIRELRSNFESKDQDHSLGTKM